jgi:hypothetical protein
MKKRADGRCKRGRRNRRLSLHVCLQLLVRSAVLRNLHFRLKREDFFNVASLDLLA